MVKIPKDFVNIIKNLTIGNRSLLRRTMDLKAQLSPSPLKNDSPLKHLGNRTPTDRPFRVSVEGNIGAGKSTLVEYFKDFKGIETYGEPIEWWRNVNGHNLLDLMYSNINQWMNVFQSYVQLTRVKVQTSKPSSSSTTVQMFERSVQNNRFCFLELAHTKGYLSGPDYAVMDQWYRWIENNINIELDLIVYLRSSPNIVYERMKSRGRPEESGVSLDYLESLHESHEKWLMSDKNTIPVLVLDADQTLDEIHRQYKMNENKILGVDKKKRPAPIDTEQREKIRKTLDLN